MPNALRPYQLHVYQQICGSSDDLLCQLPTGAGKTLILSAAVASLLNRRAVTHAVIACPQLHIAEGFLGRADRQVHCGTETVTLGPAAIRPLRANGKLDQIIHYLQRPHRGHAIAITHQSLSQIPPDRLPPALAGYLLVIDEAHHAALETNLGRFTAAWRARGGRIVSATATDFRADGQSIRLDGMRVVRRSLADHMRDRDPPGPYAPERVESEIVGVEMPDPPTPEEVEGKELPHEEHQRRMVARIVEQWEHLGRPKAIVKVPVLEGGSGELVGRLVRGFRDRTARVYDATGVGQGRQEEFVRFLEEQRGLSDYRESWDVVVGVQRVIEGTDWPWCSDVFVVGVPRSLVQTIQLLGRATRLKHWPSYDPHFRDRARITFFVSTSEGSAVEGLDLRHSNKVLALLAFMADTETGLQWVLFDQIRTGLVRGLATRRQRDGGPADQPADEAVAERIMDRLVEGIDPEYEGIARLVLAAVRQEANGKSLTVGEALQKLQEHELIRGIADEDVRVELLPKLVVRAMEAADPSGRVRRRVQSKVEERVAAGAGDLDRDDLAEVWQEVIEEFRTETMPVTTDEDRFTGFLHRLTGGTITRFAERLNERYKTTFGAPIAIEEVHAEIWDFYQREGNWPAANSVKTERFGVPFRHLDLYLLRGTRSLPGNSSLYQESIKVAAARGVPIEDRRGDNSPLTVGMVRDAIRAFHAQHGRFPVVGRDGVSPLGITWTTLSLHLTDGRRGLPGGSTLAKEIEAVRREMGLKPPEPTRELVLKAIEEYRDETGGYPIQQTRGEIPTLGMSWMVLAKRLRAGLLGGGVTLVGLIEEVRTHRGELAPGKKPKLTLAMVHEAIRAFYREHGRRPTTLKDERPCRLGLAWRTLNNAIKLGQRGLPGGTTLLEECEVALGPAAFGVKPTLTIEAVHEAIRAFYREHGERPMTKTQLPCGLGIAWSTLQNCLAHGERGLPGGSSLYRECEMALSSDREPSV
jgi:hypothetical protein